MSQITCSDSLEFLRKQEDYSFDINYSDPPYALGSEVIIRPDGKVDYKKANDFMDKWEMPTGEYWEQWFKEAYRTLKYGGYCIMFGMDRQLLLFKYYACLAGFQEQQSLYWYYISNFPKATDLGKMIDKNAGAEREIIGKSNRHGGGIKGNETSYRVPEEVPNITTPSTDLAKKYDGYKYSISPLKQTNETILIFQKPYKTGSCLHDTLAYERGDTTCCCGALDIDGNRVGTEARFIQPAGNNGKENVPIMKSNDDYKGQEVEGRYPAQTFIDSNTAEVLDKQSGVIESIRSHRGGARNDGTTVYQKIPQNIDMNYEAGYTDTGGCSKILHKCDFEKDEHDLYFYNPKVSKSERNAGCDELDEKLSAASEFRPNHLEKALNGEDGNPYGRWTPLKNNHPTLKPIKLNKNILSLFKTPNEQQIVYPFAGSGSEVIGGIKAGFTSYIGCEINQEYIDIANARIEFWKDFEGCELPETQEIAEGQISIWEEIC
jgi:DNA modification methylase